MGTIVMRPSTIALRRRRNTSRSSLRTWRPSTPRGRADAGAADAGVPGHCSPRAARDGRSAPSGPGARAVGCRRPARGMTRNHGMRQPPCTLSAAGPPISQDLRAIAKRPRDFRLLRFFRVIFTTSFIAAGRPRRQPAGVWAVLGNARRQPGPATTGRWSVLARSGEKLRYCLADAPSRYSAERRCEKWTRAAIRCLLQRPTRPTVHGEFPEVETVRMMGSHCSNVNVELKRIEKIG